MQIIVYVIGRAGLQRGRLKSRTHAWWLYAIVAAFCRAPFLGMADAHFGWMFASFKISDDELTCTGAYFVQINYKAGWRGAEQ